MSSQAIQEANDEGAAVAHRHLCGDVVVQLTTCLGLACVGGAGEGIAESEAGHQRACKSRWRKPILASKTTAIE